VCLGKKYSEHSGRVPGNHRLALTVTDALGSTASTLTWNVSISGDGAVTVTDR